MMNFAAIGSRLVELGYQPVPIRPGCKAPMVAGWQSGWPPERFLPHRHPVTGLRTDCSSWGVGILSATCPAVDLDVRHESAVAALLGIARELLGATVLRVGSPPKVLLPFTTRAPFEKITGRWWARPGEDWREPGYSPHRVEVLGRGQQFVACAIHPSTGRPYEWRHGELLTIPRAKLPELNAYRARVFLAAGDDFFSRSGSTPLRRCPNGWQVDDGRKLDFSSTRPATVRAGSADRRWQRMEPEALAKAIDARHARRIHGGWITACPAHMSEGGRSLSIMPRTGGGSITHCFGGCAFQEVADAINARFQAHDA